MRTRKPGGEPPKPSTSLKTLMARNPEAFKFPSPEKLLPPTEGEKDRALITLETAIGDYAPIEGHKGFYLKAMKLREQKAFLRFEQELRAATNELESLECMERIAVKLIYRIEGEDFRPATIEEVEIAFSGEELATAFARYGGLSKEGEAPGK